MVDQNTGPLGHDGNPIGARVETPDAIDMAIVVLKIEPRTIDRSIAKLIGPPLKAIESMHYLKQWYCTNERTFENFKHFHSW